MRTRLFLSLIFFANTSFAGGSRNFTDTALEQITPGNVNNVTTGNLTIGIWFKGAEDASLDMLIGKKRASSTANSGFGIYTGTDDIANAIVADGATINSCKASRDNDGSWVNYQMTFNGATDKLELYENMVSVCSNSAATGSISTTFNFTIGNSGVLSEQANGQLAYGFFTTTVLSDAQRRQFRYRPDSLMAGINSYHNWYLWGPKAGGTAKREYDMSGGGQTGVVTKTGLSNDAPPVQLGMAPL